MDTESRITRSKRHPKEVELLNEINVDARCSWIIGEFDSINITKITVGDDSISVSKLYDDWIFFNKILTGDRLYNVTIVLSDTFFGTTKIVTYGMSARTLPRIDTTLYFSYFWSLLLIPVLIYILCVVVW